MTRTFITLAAIASVAFALPVSAQDSGQVQNQDKVQRGADGSYSEKASSSSEGTDVNGTYTSRQTTVKTDIDANGNGKKSVETKTVDDPKGLFNKIKTSTTDTKKVKDGKVESEHEKTVNGTTVEKTTDTTVSQ